MLFVCILPSLLLVPTQSFPRFLTIHLGIGCQLLIHWQWIQSWSPLPCHSHMDGSQTSALCSAERWRPPPLHPEEPPSILFCPHGHSLSLCPALFFLSDQDSSAHRVCLCVISHPLCKGKLWDQGMCTRGSLSSSQNQKRAWNNSSIHWICAD